MFSGLGQSCEDNGTILDSSSHMGGLYMGFINAVPFNIVFLLISHMSDLPSCDFDEMVINICLINFCCIFLE